MKRLRKIKLKYFIILMMILITYFFLSQIVSTFMRYYNQVSGNVVGYGSADYSIAYELNGGTQAAGQVEHFRTEDLPITLLDPTREGYTFLGWYEEDDFSGERVTQIIAARDYTLYANWTVIENLPKAVFKSYDGVTTLLGLNRTGITSFSRNTTLTKEEVLAKGAVEIQNDLEDGYKSSYKIYGWIENNEFYWWCEDADTVYFHPETARAFSTLGSIVTIDLTGTSTSWVQNFVSWFYNDTKLERIEGRIDTSGSVLQYNEEFNYGNLDDNQNVSGYGMAFMFANDGKLEYVDLSGFNTTNVTDMKRMFYQCTSLTDLDVSHFDTKNVKSFQRMFTKVPLAQNVDLSGWDTTNAENMMGMFTFCTTPKTVTLGENFVTNKVKNMQYMFYGMTKLETIYALYDFDTSNVSNDTEMFKNDTKLVGGRNTLHETPFNGSIINSTYAKISDENQNGYFTNSGAERFYKIIYNLDGGTATNPENYQETSETITLTEPVKSGYTFIGWTGSNGDTPQISVSIPSGSSGNKEYTANYTANTYEVIFNANGGTGTQMENQVFTYDISQLLRANTYTKNGYQFNGWTTNADGSGTKYTNMEEVSNLTTEETIELYAQWKLETFNVNTEGTMLLEGYNVIKQVNTLGTNFTSMTAFLRSNTEPDESINKVNIAKTGLPVYAWWEGTQLYWYSEDEYPLLNPDLGKFFQGCTKLADISGLADFDASQVIYMQNIFQNTNALTSLEALSRWKIQNITRLEFAFTNSGITSLSGIGKWDVSKVQNFEAIFGNCSNITSAIELKDWNIGNATSISGFFSRCNLGSLSGLENWDTSKVKQMKETFYLNKNLTSLQEIANWDVSQVEDMYNLFANLENLTSLDDIQDWNVSSVKNLNKTFAAMKSLTNLDALANWNVSSVENFSYLFDACQSITSISGLENWNVSSATNMSGMFYNVNKLEDTSAIVDWDVTSSINFSSMFKSATKAILNPFSKLPGSWSDGTYIPD